MTALLIHELFVRILCQLIMTVKKQVTVAKREIRHDLFSRITKYLYFCCPLKIRSVAGNTFNILNILQSEN